MTKKQTEKLRLLTEALLRLSELCSTTRIRRYQLRRLIMFELKISDPHTVNNWVDILLVKRLICSNSSGMKKPTRNTPYTINIEECEKV